MNSLLQVMQSPAARRAGSWALRAVGPLVLAFLLIRVVDYGELQDLLGDLRYGWIVAAVGLVQVIIVLRTLRWMELHESFGLRKAPFGYQLRLTYATTLASLVLPQIINPLSRLVLLLQDGYRTGRSVAASVLEKLLDFASYLAFGVVGSIALASTFGSLVWWAVGLAIAVLFGLAVLYGARHHLGELSKAVIRRLPGAAGQQAGRVDAAQEILSLDHALAVRLFLWSLAISMTQATIVFFITRSVGIELSYPFMVAVWGIIALSLLLPLSVNGVGTREAVLVTAFSAVDESRDAAVAIGLLTLAVVAVGSSPGLIEWLRRFLVGSGRSPHQPQPAIVPPAAPAQGGNES